MTLDLFGGSGATFSECRKYRYKLWRTVGAGTDCVTFLMLNPSIAAETINDPTIRRCIGYAIRWGYGRLYISNLFAWRSTDPRVLPDVQDPIGPDNDYAILQAAQESKLIVCGWGKRGALRDRGRHVLTMLVDAGHAAKLMALKVNGDGSPTHPLYQPVEARPFRMEVTDV